MIKVLKKVVSLAAVASMFICSLSGMSVNAATNGDNVRVSEVEFIGTRDSLGAKVFVRNSGTPIGCLLVLAVYNADKTLKDAVVCKGKNGILEAGTLDASGEGEVAKAYVWKDGDISPLVEAANISKDFEEILEKLDITFDGVSFKDYIGTDFDFQNIVYNKTLASGSDYPEIRVKSDNNAVKAKIVTDEDKKTSTITIEYGVEKNTKEMYPWDGSCENAYHMVYSKENVRTYTINYTVDDSEEYKDLEFQKPVINNDTYFLSKWYEKHIEVPEGNITDVTAYIQNWARQDTFIAVKADDANATTKDVFVKPDGSDITDSDIVEKKGNKAVESIGAIGETPLMLLENIHTVDYASGKFGTPTFYPDNQNIYSYSQAVWGMDSGADVLKGGWMIIADNGGHSDMINFKVKKSVTVYILSLSDNTTVKDSAENDACSWSDKSSEKGWQISCKYQSATNIVSIAYMIKNGIIEKSDIEWKDGEKGYCLNTSRPYGWDYKITGLTRCKAKITVDGQTATLEELAGKQFFAQDAEKETIDKWLNALLDAIDVKSTIVTSVGYGNNAGAVAYGNFEYGPLKADVSTMLNGENRNLYPAWSDRGGGNYNSITHYPSVMNLYGAENIYTGINGFNNTKTKEKAITFKVNKDAEVIVFKYNNDDYIDNIPESERDGWSQLGYYKNGEWVGKWDTIGNEIGAYYGPAIRSYKMSAAKEYVAGETVKIYGSDEKAGLMIIVKPLSR